MSSFFFPFLLLIHLFLPSFPIKLLMVKKQFLYSEISSYLFDKIIDKVRKNFTRKKAKKDKKATYLLTIVAKCKICKIN